MRALIVTVCTGLLLAACSSDDSGGVAGAGGGSGSGGTGGGPPSGRCPTDITPDSELGQALPQASVEIALPATTGTPKLVAAGDDLQAALDAAAPGDVIELEAGASFQGPFTLPNFSGAGTLIIRSSKHAELPAEGERVGPEHASFMPTLLASNANDPALRAAPGAHDIRLIGIHFTTPGYVTALVDLGSNAASVADMPSQIVFDRTYFQGHATEGTRRGLALNSAATAVIDSYFQDFKEVGADSQAIGGWSGTGPYLIVNNYLEGAGENFMLGGADPSIEDVGHQRVCQRRHSLERADGARADRAQPAGPHRLRELRRAGARAADDLRRRDRQDSQVFAQHDHVCAKCIFTFGDSAPVLEQLWFTDSIVAHGDYGAFGSGQGEGTAALDHFFTSYVFSNNVIFGGGSASQYPASNSVAASSDQVGFVDAAGGNYALDDSSPYKGSASNGGDPGADMAAVKQATAAVISAN